MGKVEPYVEYDLETLRRGLEMYAPKEGKLHPNDAWYDIYFDHVPRLLATIDELQKHVDYSNDPD